MVSAADKLIPEDPISYRANDGANIHVEFVDLYNVNDSIGGIVDRMNR